MSYQRFIGKRNNCRGVETQRRRPAAWLAAIIISLVALSFLPACKRSSTPEEEEAIKGAISRFDNALTQVYRRLSVEPLRNLASDTEISKNEAILYNFIKKKVYMESELKDIRFQEFKPVSKKKMDVRVWERWRWRHVGIDTGKEAKPWVEEEYDILYHMEKKKVWIVDSLKLSTIPAEGRGR